MQVLVVFLLALLTLVAPASAGFKLVDLLTGKTRPDFPGEAFNLFSTPVISGRTVVFLTSRGGTIDALWRIDVGTRAIRKLAGLKTLVPGGSGAFVCLCQRYASDDVTPSIGDGRVAFYGMDRVNRIGLYLVDLADGKVRKLANSNDRSPDGSRWVRFGRVSLGKGLVAFRAQTALHAGIYTAPTATRAITVGIDDRTRLDGRSDAGDVGPGYYSLYDSPAIGLDRVYFLAGGLFDPSTGPSAAFRLPSARLFDNASRLAGGSGAHLRIQAIAAGAEARSLTLLADEPSTGYAGLFRPAAPDASRALATTRSKPSGFTAPLQTIGRFAADGDGAAFVGYAGGITLIGYVAATGGGVQTVARDDRGYYKPALGERALSGRRIVFREDGGAGRLILAERQ